MTCLCSFWVVCYSVLTIILNGVQCMPAAPVCNVFKRTCLEV